MRNAIVYTAILSSALTLGAAYIAFAGQPENTAQDSSGMMKGMHMMEGNKMPMMGMMQEMNSMMKNCNEMMENMNKQMGQEAAQGDNKVP